jgi:hypothetical protein
MVSFRQIVNESSFAHWCRVAVVAGSLLFFPNAFAQFTLRPVDQAASQHDFFAFRAHPSA